MKTSPRSLRLTEQGIQALKVLEEMDPDKSRTDIVSEALIAKADAAAAAKPVSFRLLDPKEFLSLQASLAETLSTHRQLRSSLIRARPANKEQAERLSKAIENADAEIDRLAELRQELAQLARTTAPLTHDDYRKIETLIKWIGGRVKKAENDEPQKQIYELELRLLSSLII